MVKKQQTTQTAKPVSKPKNTPTTQPATAHPEATAAAATPDYILYLQRTIGNRAVEGKLQQLPRPPQMMARQRPVQTTPSTGVWRWHTATVRPQRKQQLQRHTSVALQYEENSVQAKRATPQLQRHTSVALEYEENSVQARREELALPAGQLIQRDLVDDLNEAMDGWGADKQAMKNAIIAASATEKEQALNDPRLVARLQDQLSRADALEILTDLGATLSKRLEVAMNGWGADADAIISMVEGLPASKAAEKDAVLRNPTLMNRLKDELSQAQAVRVLTGLGAPIAERIYAAMDGWGVDTATIIGICTNATPAEKQAAARDRALIARLTEEISQSYLVQYILKELNVSIIDRLHVAMDGWGVDAQSILNMSYEASADEKQLILHDRETLSRLQSELSREDMLTVLKNIDASLTDRLNVALSGWGVDSTAILEMIPQASEEQRLAAYSDAQLMADLEAQMSAEDFRQARLLLRFGSQEAIDAASEEELNAATSPENLTSLITAELAKDEPDTAKIMTDIAAATPADKELVRANSSLMERLAGALAPEEYRQAQNLLGDSLINQLHTLIDQEAGIDEFLTLINGMAEPAKQEVLANRGILDAMLGYFSQEENQRILTALGDWIINQLQQALADGAALDAVLTIIEAATVPQRDEVKLAAELLGRFLTTYGAIGLWRVRLHLEYGNAASYPAGVTTLLNTLQNSPDYNSIRQTIANMSNADFNLMKDTPGVRDVLQTLVTAEQYIYLLRMLDQGLIVDETVNEGYSETLQNDDPSKPGNIFEPMVYTGTGAFDVGYYRDRMQIDVRINMNPADDGAKTKLSTYESTLEAQIEGIWDNKYKVRNSNGDLPIRINCAFTSSNPHHNINVYSKVNGVNYGEYNLSNWYPDANGFSSNAPSHEFGHMLGNKDEYNLSAADYQATVGNSPVGDPNATKSTDDVGNERFTNDSVMGSNTAARVDPRHLNYFVNWINDNRRKDGAGKFIEPAFTLVP